MTWPCSEVWQRAPEEGSLCGRTLALGGSKERHRQTRGTEGGQCEVNVQDSGGLWKGCVSLEV